MGICILKMFPEPTIQKVERKTHFEEHKTAILDYQNNETETNLNLSIAFKESFEQNLAGYISQNNTDLRWDCDTIGTALRHFTVSEWRNRLLLDRLRRNLRRTYRDLRPFQNDRQLFFYKMVQSKFRWPSRFLHFSRFESKPSTVCFDLNVSAHES